MGNVEPCFGSYLVQITNDRIGAGIMKKYARLRAIEYYLPEEIVSNAALSSAFPDWMPEKILEKTGIIERHIAGVHETASDLAYHAAEKLFLEHGVDKDDIDFLIFCTQTPDHLLPTSACLIHEKLGLKKHCGALDIGLGCSGYVYGLSLAKAMIESGISKNVLFLTGDTYSKYMHPKDRSVRTLFGDAATASLIVSSDEVESKIGPFVFGTDGAGADNLIIPAGGSRLFPSTETAIEYTDSMGNVRSQNHLYMNGPEIMSFTLSSVPTVFKEILLRAGKTIDEIDHVVFHQANKFMLEALRKKIKIPHDKFIIELDTVGNTVSSTIPIAIARAKQKGQIHCGDNVLILGFGVGYSWGAAILESY